MPDYSSSALILLLKCEQGNFISNIKLLGIMSSSMLLLLSSLLASLVAAQQGCVDLSKFDKVDWSEEKVDFCIYQSIEKTCEVKSEEVCVPVPVTTCELHSYTECAHVELSTFQVANDRTETLEFVPNK